MNQPYNNNINVHSIDLVGGHLFHNQIGKNMIYTRDFKKYAKMLIEMCVIEK